MQLGRDLPLELAAQAVSDVLSVSRVVTPEEARPMIAEDDALSDRYRTFNRDAVTAQLSHVDGAEE